MMTNTNKATELKIKNFRERQIVSDDIAREILSPEAFSAGAGWGRIGSTEVYCHEGSHREGNGWQIHSFGGLR